MTDRTKIKQHACRYIDVDTSEMQETLTEYMDPTKTYDELKPWFTHYTQDWMKEVNGLSQTWIN